MGAGIPGTGMATLFYIVSVLAMPLTELMPTIRGQSSWARWRLIARHLVTALAMTAAVFATFRYLPGLLLPQSRTIGGMSALAITFALFIAYLVLTNLFALLVPGRVELPEPRDFPERRKHPRPDDVAPTFHSERQHDSSKGKAGVAA